MNIFEIHETDVLLCVGREGLLNVQKVSFLFIYEYMHVCIGLLCVHEEND